MLGIIENTKSLTGITNGYFDELTAEQIKNNNATLQTDNVGTIRCQQLYVNGQVIDSNGDSVNLTGITYDATTDTTNIDNNMLITKNLNINGSNISSTNIIIEQAIPYLSSYTQTINNATNTFQNGQYVVNASSYQLGNDPYKVFDNSSYSFWRTSSSYPRTNNSSTCGQYNGSVNTIDAYSNTAHFGDWVQVNLPYSFVINSFDITKSNSSDSLLVLPNILSLFGSTDNSHWYLINKSVNISDSTTINFDNDKTFAYYRFVIEKTNMTQGTSLAYYSEIGNLNLIGVMNSLTVSAKGISLTGYTTTDGDLEIPSNNRMFLNGMLMCNFTLISPVVMSYLYGLSSNAQSQLDNKLNSIVIGTISTLNSGSNAWVSAVNNNNVCTLSMGIPMGPRGPQGPKGDASDTALIMSSVIAGVVGVGAMAVLMDAMFNNLLTDLFGSLIDSITGQTRTADDLSAEQRLQQQIRAIIQKLNELDSRVAQLEEKTYYMVVSNFGNSPQTSFVGSSLRVSNNNKQILLDGGTVICENVSSAYQVSCATINSQGISVTGNGRVDFTHANVWPLELNNDASFNQYIFKCVDTRIPVSITDPTTGLPYIGYTSKTILDITSDSAGITAYSNTYFNQNLVCSGDLITFGRTNSSIQSTTTVNGNLIINKYLDSTAQILCNTTIGVANASVPNIITLNGTSYINGDLNITGNLVVTGNITANEITTNSNLHVYEDLHTHGNIDVLGSIVAHENLSVGVDLNVNNNVNVNGNIECSDLTCTDLHVTNIYAETITATDEILAPTITATQELIANTLTCNNNLSVGGTATISNLVVTNYSNIVEMNNPNGNYIRVDDQMDQLNESDNIFNI